LVLLLEPVPESGCRSAMDPALASDSRLVSDWGWASDLVLVVRASLAESELLVLSAMSDSASWQDSTLRFPLPPVCVGVNGARERRYRATV
jgi:hypothetical protein